ncbi:hypothetical protein [Sulfobacillus thermosulfidooxidans]|uniref:hypothetical protein n=1 Tax=Sulfobacillus thermosulfidooxidans TaxID=28034 RepID=UPI00096B6DF5|nr:hypothetical protein [Sulfobacillus thermosulfidooxidans]OLZ09013.1 hypothetical protein BFX05_02095 [Sulfobacillus thermosulfidooxidans]OLZ14199.1 hypothetical protein BFX06_07865 [Sulfobacillus thermosulfidooxidans]OLZ18942.1 hypothetical protein BFX07_04260 [Sulfobacillus thermosulfidooxidans]
MRNRHDKGIITHNIISRYSGNIDQANTRKKICTTIRHRDRAFDEFEEGCHGSSSDDHTKSALGPRWRNKHVSGKQDLPSSSYYESGERLSI